jgi:predicted O-linked N-acetylglucosamine transferase (SPINDLY family)
VLSVGAHDDPLAARFRAAADRYVALPRQVRDARDQIAATELDVLLFADVGMDALTYTLAFSRMAPVQVATWGHPVTTGSPTMDYFLSSELLETTEADAHYTERLVRRPTLATYYVRPELTQPRRTRRELGLSDDRRLYLCPQTLFKFHPEFDATLAAILRGDPQGELVLIEGRTKNWTEQLQARFTRVMPDVVDRVRWLPALPNDRFLQLLAVGDVMLDPFHFGGGNTSYESLAIGTPVVTRPGLLLRSRIAQALYRSMAEKAEELPPPGLIAASAEEYAAAALELAAPGRRRDAARGWIAAHADAVFEDAAAVRDFAGFLESIAR